MNLRKYVIGLHKKIRRLNSFKVAYQEWSDKTDWVQQSVQSGELGKHRADAIKARYDALKAENESLRKDARLLDILAEAMAEVKATSDGESEQPIADIVSGCLAEIAAISSPENPS
jgi:CRISPR/Cas system-associated endoribonuclease Cas2